ncbi:tRNA isopentenyl-2-thiomethyl-A-37 hydroxylase MiaE [Alteromonas flava]|nr:tRNA isopentenyl-2-thiomethyl-A-37 hydroxylase MiaE [Alteromonas flava]
MYSDNLLAPIHEFLLCETPDNWVGNACESANLPVLLVDHANCELNA